MKIIFVTSASFYDNKLLHGLCSIFNENNFISEIKSIGSTQHCFTCI
jgi:hypothetical protein